MTCPHAHCEYLEWNGSWFQQYSLHCKPTESILTQLMYMTSLKVRSSYRWENCHVIQLACGWWGSEHMLLEKWIMHPCYLNLHSYRNFSFRWGRCEGVKVHERLCSFKNDDTWEKPLCLQSKTVAFVQVKKNSCFWQLYDFSLQFLFYSTLQRQQVLLLLNLSVTQRGAPLHALNIPSELRVMPQVSIMSYGKLQAELLGDDLITRLPDNLEFRHVDLSRQYAIAPLDRWHTVRGSPLLAVRLAKRSSVEDVACVLQ